MGIALSGNRLDRWAIGLSGLCVVHCLATAVALAMLSAAGLSFAMMLGALALGRGILEHGFMMPSAVGSLGLGVMGGALTLPHDNGEALYTVIGVGILALGHQLNRIAGD